MTTPLIIGQLVVKKSSIHGYGVFAAQDFACGDTIEECYTLTCSKVDNAFQNYQYHLVDDRIFGLPLGYGCIYNHATTPNADYCYDEKRSLLVIRAEKMIKKGEEIFVNYGDQWFNLRGIRMKQSLRHRLLTWATSTLFLARFACIVSVLFALIWFMKGH